MANIHAPGYDMTGPWAVRPNPLRDEDPMPLSMSRVSCKAFRWRMIGALAISLPSLLASPVQAQSDTARWVLVAPGPQYEAGAVWRMFFGTDWRDLWTTPTKVEVLNLRTFAGGLTPLKQGGGQQTKSLRFQAADGRQFNFRSVLESPAPMNRPMSGLIELQSAGLLKLPQSRGGTGVVVSGRV